MKIKRHKYFRSKQFKQKLETRYNNGDGSIYFTTNDICPQLYKRSRTYYMSHPYIYCPREYDRARGRECYLYWDRPTVEYSIRESENNKSAWKQLMKKQTARRNRHIKIDVEDSTPQAKSYYKRVEDIWNYD